MCLKCEGSGRVWAVCSQSAVGSGLSRGVQGEMLFVCTVHFGRNYEVDGRWGMAFIIRVILGKHLDSWSDSGVGNETFFTGTRDQPIIYYYRYFQVSSHRQANVGLESRLRACRQAMLCNACTCTLLEAVCLTLFSLQLLVIRS